jgi:iron complex outermembrane receptor protein
MAQSGVSTLKQLSVEELSQIEVVSASKEPTEAFRSPVAVYVVTGDQIRRSGATTIPDALRLAPGVEVAQIDGNKWSVGIRGFGSRLSRSVLVLIDGRTVYTTLFAGTYWEVQDTVMEDIDRIEVIRGPGGTIWGPNAVNGVINIITREAKTTHGNLVSAGGGNVEQGSLTYRYGGGNGQTFDWRVYAKSFTRGPEHHQDSANFDDWRAVQTGGRMDWTRARGAGKSTDAFTVQGDFYREEAGERVQATSYTAPYSQNVDANANLSGGNILARWKRTLSNGGDIQFQTYYDRTNRHEPNFGELRNNFDADFQERFPVLARQRFTWGLGARLSQGDGIDVVSGLTFTPLNRTDDLLTGFFQDEIALIENELSVTVGTKLLHTEFTHAALEPTARLAWTPGTKNTLWAAVTHTVRTPSRVETDMNLLGYVATLANGTPYLARFNANPDFAPEQMTGYELGFRRLLTNSLSVDIASFYNHYHDLLSEEITGAPFLETDPAPTHYLLPAQFRNGLLANTKGVELSSDWSPAKFWRLSGSYSFLHMNVERKPLSADVGTAPIVAGSSPGHEATIQSSFDISRKVELDLTYRYVSALPGQLVPAYSTGDARLGWRIGGYLELALVGRNLFQPWHFEYGGDPGPLAGISRNVYARLTWSK